MPRTKKKRGVGNDRGRPRRPPTISPPPSLLSHADPSSKRFTDVIIGADYGVLPFSAAAVVPPTPSSHEGGGGRAPRRSRRLGFGSARRNGGGPKKGRKLYDYQDDYDDDDDDASDSGSEYDSDDEERMNELRKRCIGLASFVVLSAFVGSCWMLFGGASYPHGNKSKFGKNPLPTSGEYDPWGEEGDMGVVREHPGDYDHGLTMPEETSGDFEEVDDDDGGGGPVEDWSGNEAGAAGGLDGGTGGTVARPPEDWLEDDDGAIGEGGAEEVDDAGEDDKDEDDEGDDAGPPAGQPVGGNDDPDLESLRGLGQLSEPHRPGIDLPIFWHVPKCGGTTLEDILVHCANLVAACQIGVLNGHDKDKEIRIVTYPPDNPANAARYVNVDTHSPEGIERAHRLRLGVSGLADVALTEYLHQASWIFAPPAHVGKCFALLRHPIERAVSMFYYLREAKWESTYDAKFEEETILQYARSEKVEENWMVRYLTNEPTEFLTRNHLEYAKAVLKEKCLVGLLDEFERSLRRFESYFGWKDMLNHDPKQQQSCERYVLDKGGDNIHPHPTFKEGSEVWEAFRKINVLDLELYEYAQGLFEGEQAVYDP